MKIDPIFVLGRQRSGTTWITNILASHDDIFTPLHEAHQGQHESAFFSALVPYCNFAQTEQDRIALKAIFERSDFFQLVQDGQFPPPSIRGLDASAYFRRVMDLAAERRGCSMWLEKTPAHTLCLSTLLECFPDAYFIAVTRKTYEVVRSNVYKFGDPGSLSAWIRATILTKIYEKMLRRYKDRLCMVKYEELLTHYDETVSRIISYLGLENAGAYSSQYQRVSSYDEKAPKKHRFNKILVTCFCVGLELIPSSGLQILIDRKRARRRGKLPPWFFKLSGSDPTNERS